jgi:outer membrane autotransporter protein
MRATIDSVLAGAGGLDKLDLGTLTLGGANSYTGGTHVAAGTLRITGSVAGDIANDAALVFDRADTATYAGTISGSGSLTKAGAGTLVLTGASTYTGATTVAAGTLAVNGAIARSAVTVAAGATLAGSGTTGGTTVAGAVSPSGVLTIGGGYTQAAGSTYVWQPGDLVRVAGAATIAGGRVQAANQAAGLQLGARTAILTSAGARSGTYAGLDLANPVTQPFLTLGLTYDANAVYLEAVRNGVTFASAGGTVNQRAAASGVDGMAAGAPVAAAIANLADLATARRGFDALSGEIHATLKGVLLDQSANLRDALNTRLAQAPDASVDRGMGLWVQARGGRGHADGDGNAASLDRWNWGWLFGFDAALGGGLRAGVTAGYERSHVNQDDRASLAKIDTVHLGAYAGGRWGGTRLQAGATYGWSDIATTRVVGFPGFADRERANYKGRQLQLFAEAAHRFGIGEAGIEPFAGIAWAQLKTDRFAEQGGPGALHARRQSESAAWTTLGLRADAPIGAGVRLFGSAAWRHTLEGRVASADLAFAGGAPFRVYGTPIDKDAAALSAGLALELPGDALVALGYAGTLGSATSNHGARASLSIRF